MQDSTMIDRMRFAVQQYRIDQPDSYTFAIYGPNDFSELHDNYARAFERKEELGLLDALKAISVPSEAMVEAGEQVLKDGQIEKVWQALLNTIVAEYRNHREGKEDASSTEADSCLCPSATDSRPS